MIRTDCQRIVFRQVFELAGDGLGAVVPDDDVFAACQRDKSARQHDGQHTARERYVAIHNELIVFRMMRFTENFDGEQPHIVSKLSVNNQTPR